MSAMADPSLEARLEEIWVRHLPDTIRRIERVIEVSKAIERGEGDPRERESAGAAAHRVAGIAATYGRSRVADIARRAERLLEAPELTTEGIAELASVAGELAEMTRRGL